MSHELVAGDATVEPSDVSDGGYWSFRETPMISGRRSQSDRSNAGRFRAGIVFTGTVSRVGVRVMSTANDEKESDETSMSLIK